MLDTFNLDAAERLLCVGALARAGSIVGAAALLGITRHALTRRMTRLGLEAPGPSCGSSGARVKPNENEKARSSQATRTDAMK